MSFDGVAAKVAALAFLAWHSSLLQGTSHGRSP